MSVCETEISRLKAETASLLESLREGEARDAALNKSLGEALAAAEQRAEEQFQKATRQAERAEAAEKERDALEIMVKPEAVAWFAAAELARRNAETQLVAAEKRAAAMTVALREALATLDPILNADLLARIDAALHDEERRQRGGCPGFGVTKEQLDKALADGEKDREAMEVENSKQRPPGGKW